MNKSNLVEIELHIHQRTHRAILVSDDGDCENAVWLPISQIDVETINGKTIVMMPEWLATERGLV